jgi:hypothetical protein
MKRYRQKGGCDGSKHSTGRIDGAFAFRILDEVLGQATTFTEWLVAARAGNNPVLGHGLVAIWLLGMKMEV